MKFALGYLVASRELHQMMADSVDFYSLVYSSLRRHVSGDRGDCAAEDRKANEGA